MELFLLRMLCAYLFKKLQFKTCIKQLILKGSNLSRLTSMDCAYKNGMSPIADFLFFLSKNDGFTAILKRVTLT